MARSSRSAASNRGRCASGSYSCSEKTKPRLVSSAWLRGPRLEANRVDHFEVAADLGHLILDEGQVIPIELVGRVVEPYADRVHGATAAERIRTIELQQRI